MRTVVNIYQWVNNPLVFLCPPHPYYRKAPPCLWSSPPASIIFKIKIRLFRKLSVLDCFAIIYVKKEDYKMARKSIVDIEQIDELSKAKALKDIITLEKQLEDVRWELYQSCLKRGALIQSYQIVEDIHNMCRVAKDLIEDVKNKSKKIRVTNEKISNAVYKHFYNAHVALAPYSFHHFLVCMEWNYPPEMKFYANRYKVLKDWAIQLERLEFGEIDLLGLSAPPRSGKTGIGTLFLCWVLGRHPDKSSFFVSHTNAMAIKVFGDVFNLITDERRGWNKIFSNFDIQKNSEYLWIDLFPKKNINNYKSIYFRGMDSNMAGNVEASHLIYCDDLIKGIEEALNPIRLETVWTKYAVDIRQRRESDVVKELHIATRWSINDVLSRLEEDEDNQDKKVFIKVAGLNENEKSNFNFPYSPMTTEHFLKLKETMDSISFECIIQQNPVERDGLLFAKDSLNYYDGILPDGEPDGIYFACDVAWGGHDYLSMPIGILYGRECYIVDVVHSNASKDITKQLVANKIIQYKCVKGFFEANNGGDEYADDISERLKKQNHRCAISYKKAPTNRSKLDRILACVPEIKGTDENGYKLIFLSAKVRKNNKPYELFMKHLLQFNQGQKYINKQFDDSADVLASLVTNVLECGNKGTVKFFSAKLLAL